MGDPIRNDERELFRTAFDLAPSGMMVVGASGDILLANAEAERLFGYASGALVGVSVDQLVPHSVRHDHAHDRRRYFDSPQARPMGAGRDLFGLHRDGSEFPIEVGLNPVVLGGTRVVIASVVDISARRRAEAEARQAEERHRQAQKLESLGTLAGGIAHDFNNILLGIVGYTELAQRQLRDAPGVQDDLAQVLVAAERGRQLVRRILSFSRHRDATPVPLPLERVVREACELLRASLPATIEMRVAIDPGLPLVMAEETLVHQVVMNLCTNSAHAMPDGGVLQVRLALADPEPGFVAAHPGMVPGRCVRLSVIDTGHGIPPEVRARIFEPFFTTKSAGEGSGLGLSVILGIVQSLSGAIEIDSEPGKGTRVDVWLPLAPAPEGAVSGAPGAPAEEAGPARHVLFVEDEPALAAMERRQLEALGLRVTVHTSSLEALDDFRSRPTAFDLMVTDNTMPHMTGMMLARKVTSLRPGLPVLMVSGYAENADTDVMREHGVTGVLRKPHTLKELEEALQRVLGE